MSYLKTILYKYVPVCLAILFIMISGQVNGQVVDISLPDSTEAEESFIMRWTENVLDFTSIEREKYSVKLYPVFGYEPQTGGIFGVKPILAIYNKNGYTTTLTSELSISTEGQFKGGFNLNGYTNSNWNIVAEGEYLKRQDNWYGLGQDDNPEKLFSFDNQNLSLTGTVSKGIGKFFIGFSYDFASVNLSGVDSIGFGPNVKGSDGGTLLGIGPLVRFDNRNNTIFPSSGSYLELSTTMYPNLTGNDGFFTTYSLDYRQFWKIKSESNIIGFQTKFGGSTDNTPFYRMPIMADKDNLRGTSHPFKYIDRNMWYTQTEYRRHLWWRVNVNAWVGVGNTFEDFNDDPLKDFKFVYGFGGRFTIDDREKINIRADLGFGPNGDYGLYFTFLEAF